MSRTAGDTYAPCESDEGCCEAASFSGSGSPVSEIARTRMNGLPDMLTST